MSKLFDQDKPRIAVKLVSQYGVDRIFPVCSNASRFAAIAGTKTLSPAALVQACRLGFVIKIDGYEATKKVSEMMEPFAKEVA